MSANQITTISIEHVTVVLDRPYEQVIALIEAQTKTVTDIDSIMRQLQTQKASWDQVTQAIEKLLGQDGFVIFCKVEHSALLSLAGNAKKAIQYTIGNPLLAIQMTTHVLQAALYAPFKLIVYEDERKRTVIAYDRFSSFLSQFNNNAVNRIAEQVDKKLDELLIILAQEQ